MSFATLGLSPALVRAVREQGYHAPTAIQSAAIPAILRGADVLGLAQTGSGKTAAFALPLLQRVIEGEGPAPTGRGGAGADPRTGGADGRGAAGHWRDRCRGA